MEAPATGAVSSLSRNKKHVRFCQTHDLRALLLKALWPLIWLAIDCFVLLLTLHLIKDLKKKNKQTRKGIVDFLKSELPMQQGTV